MSKRLTANEYIMLSIKFHNASDKVSDVIDSIDPKNEGQIESCERLIDNLDNLYCRLREYDYETIDSAELKLLSKLYDKKNE